MSENTSTTAESNARTEISFEFFPPRDAGSSARMRAAAGDLTALRPAFCSVTHGAGGSTRDATPDAVAAVHAVTGGPVAPHLAALGTPVAELHALLERYQAAGIERLVALRGDRPSSPVGEVRAAYPPGSETVESLGHGSELVEFIRAGYGDRFRIYVAAYPECHPESESLQSDLHYFKRKVDAGADAAITQYFYSAAAYERFAEDAARAGITVPIIAGVMPIHDFGQTARFSARCGAEIPRWLSYRMRGFRDEQSQRAFAADVVAELCQSLLALGAPGFHFYTLNRPGPTRAVLERLGLALEL